MSCVETPPKKKMFVPAYINKRPYYHFNLFRDETEVISNN